MSLPSHTWEGLFLPFLRMSVPSILKESVQGHLGPRALSKRPEVLPQGWGCLSVVV